MPRLSAEGLKAKIAKLQKQLAVAENEKGPAIRKIRAMMKKLGVTVEDLATKISAPTGRKPRRKTAKNAGQRASAKIPVKYRDENGNTWTGRGKTPLWIVEAEKAGKSRDAFKVA
jgi:DNA-binding protein H-NS